MNRTSISVFIGTVASALLLPMQTAQAAHERVVYSFAGGVDGAIPEAGLVDVSGKLYGTTQSGGTSSVGTVFSVDPHTGIETVLYSFTGGADGGDPRPSLINLSGTLYGTTSGGGASGFGTLFSIDPRTGTETVLYSFAGSPTDGLGGGGLVSVGGTLYGTTFYGGASVCSGSGCGTVFSFDLHTGTETVMHSFSGGADGASPTDGLVAVSGLLFGTTYGGGGAGCGGSGCGSVFSVDSLTGAEAVVHSFSGGADGARGTAGLAKLRGLLYGTTLIGGGAGCGGIGCGTVFSFDPVGGTEKVLYSFTGGVDGDAPEAGPINVKGTLYGTTYVGGGAGCGGSGCGTVFSFDPLAHSETVLHSFAGGGDGQNPSGRLFAKGKKLYGSTEQGGGAGCGGDGCGTVFLVKH